MNEALIVELSLREFPEVRAIYLFGSQASNTALPDSDVDLALLFAPAKARAIGPLATSKAKRLLEEGPGKAVDLINLRGVNTVFRIEIIDGSRLLFFGELARGRRVRDANPLGLSETE